MARKFSFALVAFCLALSGCSFGAKDEPVAYKADFERAIQVFPAVKVRVLGVEVGHVVSVRNVGDHVQVSFVITDPTVRVSANVHAAVLPASLLGERSIQLFPAYRGGPAWNPRNPIGLNRTAVPAEPDEVLRALQDYLGRLDQKTVTKFVENAAGAVQHNGAALNEVIHYAANVFRVLSTKGDELAQTFVELNKLTVATATRQAAVGRLIRNYAAVAGTITNNRRALEGTIDGLNQASLQLASVLSAHLNPLKRDVENLTRTSRTLGRKENALSLALTGKWATSLFNSARPGVAYDAQHKWLRLNNQGEPLFELIIARIEQRLLDWCNQLGVVDCGTPTFFTTSAPNLFCIGQLAGQKGCPSLPKLPTVFDPGQAEQQLTDAINGVPELHDAFALQAKQKNTSVRGLVHLIVQGVLSQMLGSPVAVP